MNERRSVVRTDAEALAERLTILAEQLQGASGELADLVAELKVQSDEDMSHLEQELEDERAKPQQ